MTVPKYYNKIADSTWKDKMIQDLNIQELNSTAGGYTNMASNTEYIIGGCLTLASPLACFIYSFYNSNNAQKQVNTNTGSGYSYATIVSKGLSYMWNHADLIIGYTVAFISMTIGTVICIYNN